MWRSRALPQLGDTAPAQSFYPCWGAPCTHCHRACPGWEHRAASNGSKPGCFGTAASPTRQREPWRCSKHSHGATRGCPQCCRLPQAQIKACHGHEWDQAACTASQPARCRQRGSSLWQPGFLLSCLQALHCPRNADSKPKPEELVLICLIPPRSCSPEAGRAVLLSQPRMQSSRHQEPRRAPQHRSSLGGGTKAEGDPNPKEHTDQTPEIRGQQWSEAPSGQTYTAQLLSSALTKASSMPLSTLW